MKELDRLTADLPQNNGEVADSWAAMLFLGSEYGFAGAPDWTGVGEQAGNSLSIMVRRAG